MKSVNCFSFYGNSFIDFPNQISCVVFYNRCNFRCPFCHNWDLLDGRLEGFSEEQIISKIEERKDFVEAIVISGGEPTIYDNIIPFLRKIKNIGLKVKLDTNGYRYDVLYRIISENIVDYIAMDIKTSFSRYSSACGAGVDVSNIIRSMEAIKRSKIDHEFRTTCVPLLVDENDVKSIHSLVGNSNYKLQNFSSDKVLDSVFNSVIPYGEKKMSEMRRNMMETTKFVWNDEKSGKNIVRIEERNEEEEDNEEK